MWNIFKIYTEEKNFLIESTKSAAAGGQLHMLLIEHYT